MARRKANVQPRVKPSQALPAFVTEPPKFSGIDPADVEALRSGALSPEAQAYDPANAEKDPDPNNYPAPAGEKPADPGESEEPTSPPQDERTLGELLGINPAVAYATPVIPEGLMSDDPFPGQTPADQDRPLVADPRERQLTQTGGRPLESSLVQAAVAPAQEPVQREEAAPQTPADVGLDRDRGARADDRRAPVPGVVPFIPLGDAAARVVEYVQRITVTQAYQFDGHVQTAPPWVDRNWLGHDDEARYSHGSGVILDIPTIGKAYVGDYVVSQSVLLDESGERVNQVVVYDREAFERLFLPMRR